MSAKLKAFHNDQKIKNKYLDRVIAYQKADNLVRGTGWENGKGCAVGCTLEDYDHKRYEIELGIPEWLAKVEDALFEGMSLKKSKTWPETFLRSIKPGVDLEKARAPFMILILKNCIKSMDSAAYDEKKNPEVKAAIKKSKKAVLDIIKCWKTGADRSAAQLAARSAAESAWSAAQSAAWSAAWSAAESAAESAVRSAAWSAAESAARSAAQLAARSAAWSAADAAAWSAARSAAFDLYANGLIKILKGLK